MKITQNEREDFKMNEDIYSGIKNKIIDALTGMHEMVLEDRMNHDAFTMSSTQIDYMNQEVFDNLFLEINGYENEEYSILTNAVEVLNEGWHSYIFAYEKDSELDWEYKKNFVENLLKYQHQIAEYLIMLAKNKRTISYPDFHEDLLQTTENNLDIFAKDNRIAWDVVEFVCHDLRGKEMLNLSSLIITKKGVPADGYFDVMKTWGVYNSKISSEEEFHSNHLEKIYDYYQDYETF